MTDMDIEDCDGDLAEIEGIAQARAERMRDWQPIETAPTDCAVLTIWDGVNNRTGRPARYWNVACLDEGEWHAADEYGDVIDTPTHWMPLPAPPSAKREDSDG